jgi:hypothetical protein
MKKIILKTVDGTKFTGNYVETNDGDYVLSNVDTIGSGNPIGYQGMAITGNVTFIRSNVLWFYFVEE